MQGCRKDRICCITALPLDSITVILYLHSMTTPIQISSRGTLTLPKPLRRKLGIDDGGVVLAEATEDGIILQPAATFPIEVYTDERIAEFDSEDAALEQRLQGRRG